MQSCHTILLSLLVVSNVMAAEPPADLSALEQAQRIEQRIDLAQVQAQAERARDAAERERHAAERERKARRAPTEEESLALAAMEGLMAQPPERALPILKKVLAGSQSTLIKQRALFVLSQMDAPEAQELLLQATRSSDPDLQREAIRNVGIGGQPKSLAALQEIYNKGDSAVRGQVLEAWMIAGRKDEVYQAAVNAKSDVDLNEAIRMLSVMGAVEELRKLGDRPNAASGLVDAYAISGDLASLRKIAEGNSDVAVRSEAVRKMGIINNDASRASLRDIYSRSPAGEIKDAALQGLLISSDEQGVLALYRSAKTTEEKRQLLRTLSMIDGDAALQAIDAALEETK